MKKHILLSLLCVFVVLKANAQDADLVSGFMGDSLTGETHDIKKSDKEVADDRGAFSFLNFSFIKKPIALFSSKDKKEDAQKQTDSQKEENAPASNAEDAQAQTQSTENAKQPPKEETPLEKAVRLAEEGDAENALGLGYMYLYGQNGVETDYKKAFHFYEIAAKQNNIIALNNLGSLYFNGIGTDTDYNKAAALFKKAAELGSDDAALNLAFIYLSSKQESYVAPAIALLDQAVKAGNNTAKFMLGYAYYKGVGVEQDYYEAVNLIREAAKADFDEAEYVFATIYINGDGIAQNYGNAVKYYRMAIAQGNVSAMMDLAKILVEGKMFPQNLVQAHILYNIASVYGVATAAENRDSIENSLKLEELLEAQNSAESYHESPSELTQYIRQTFGSNVRKYIDDNMPKKGKKSDQKPQI